MFLKFHILVVAQKLFFLSIIFFLVICCAAGLSAIANVRLLGTVTGAHDRGRVRRG